MLQRVLPLLGQRYGMKRAFSVKVLRENISSPPPPPPFLSALSHVFVSHGPGLSLLGMGQDVLPAVFGQGQVGVRRDPLLRRQDFRGELPTPPPSLAPNFSG